MKINKGMSVLLASMLISSMLVGCNDNSNTDTNKAITKSVKATEDKKEDAPPKDNKESSSKNIPESVKKKSKAKETITVESYKCKYCGDTIYYIIEDKEYGINGDICYVCYWNKIMETIEDDVETEADDSDIEEDDVETEVDDSNEADNNEDYDDGELDEEYYEYENSDNDYDYDTEDDYDTEEYDDDDYDEPIQEDDDYEIENYNEEEE